MREQVDELARMSRLRRFLSPRLAQVLVSMDAESLLQTHRSVIAVLCCQLVGFVAFAETAAPEEVVALLAEYHAALGEVIRRVEATGGGVDEDRVTIIFNDPIPSDEPASEAVRLGLALREHLEARSRQWHTRGHDLAIAMGIDFGYATLGTFGLEDRLEYGAIGLVRRIAEALCRHAGRAQLLISRRAHAALKGQLAATVYEEVGVEGMLRPVEALSVQTDLQRTRGVLVDDRSRLSPRELEVIELVAAQDPQLTDLKTEATRTLEALPPPSSAT